MIKQKDIILELYKESNGLHQEEMVKEIDCLIDEIQKVMLERIKIFKDLTPEQLNILAMEIK